MLNCFTDDGKTEDRKMTDNFSTDRRVFTSATACVCKSAFIEQRQHGSLDITRHSRKQVPVISSYKFVQYLLDRFSRKASCRDVLHRGFCAVVAQWVSLYPGKSRFVT